MNTQLSTSTETCKALEFLEKSEIIEIEGHLLHNWRLETLDCSDDEGVFECSFTDEDGYIFEYGFTKEALLNAVVNGNIITLMDDTDEKVVIGCFNLTPVQ